MKKLILLTAALLMCISSATAAPGLPSGSETPAPSLDGSTQISDALVSDSKEALDKLMVKGMTLEEAVKELLKNKDSNSEAILQAALDINPNFDFTSLSATASGNESDRNESDRNESDDNGEASNDHGAKTPTGNNNGNTGTGGGGAVSS